MLLTSSVLEISTSILDGALCGRGTRTRVQGGVATFAMELDTPALHHDPYILGMSISLIAAQAHSFLLAGRHCGLGPGRAPSGPSQAALGQHGATIPDRFTAGWPPSHHPPPHQI